MTDCNFRSRHKTDNCTLQVSILVHRKNFRTFFSYGLRILLFYKDGLKKTNTCLNHPTKEKSKHIQAGIQTLGQWTIEIAAEQIHGSCPSLFT